MTLSFALPCIACSSEPATPDPVPSMSCEEIDQAYLDAVEEALECDPQLENPCIEMVDDTLPCPCPLYVSPSGPLRRISQLKQAWQDSACKPGPCETECSLPSEAICAVKLGNLLEGHCENR